MSGRVQIRARARSDLLEIAAWLDEESQTDVGNRFIEAAFDTFDFLAASPTPAAVSRAASSRFAAYAAGVFAGFATTGFTTGREGAGSRSCGSCTSPVMRLAASCEAI